MLSPFQKLTPAILLCTLTACGSGFVALFSDGGSTGPAPVPEPRVPALVLRTASAPLLPPALYIMEVVTQNYELPDQSRVSVELRALGQTAVPGIHIVPDPNTVQFLFGSGLGRTTPITDVILREALARWGQNAAAERDIQAELAVLVDGVEIAQPLPLILLHQSKAELAGNTPDVILSPLGETVAARMFPRVPLHLPDPATFQPGTAQYRDNLVLLNSISVKVAFGASPVERPVEITDAAPGPNGELEVTFLMPPVEEPQQAHFLVESIPSGRSTVTSNLFYRPALFGTSPANGASEGGTDVGLFGQALVPIVEKDPGQIELDFTRLALRIRKGGRETAVPTEFIRQGLSTSNRLVFDMPRSPDGRPGPADVLLGVTIDAIAAGAPKRFVEAEAKGIFTYGDSYTYFGPRGAQLRDPPVLVRVAPFVDPSSQAVDALAVSSGPLGMPFVSTMTTRGNGLFTRFGQPVRSGDPRQPTQRYPVDLCIANFVGDDTQAGVILNRGSGAVARYSILLGSTKTNPPLTFHTAVSPSPFEAGLACESGDLNRDGIADLVVLPSPTSITTVPQLFLSKGSVQVRNPTFDKQIFATYPGPFSFTALAVADVDSDGNLDLVFAEGGAAPRLLVAFGAGTNQFSRADVLDLKPAFAGTGYTPDAASVVIGVHVAESVVLVFSGVAGSTASPPAVVSLTKSRRSRSFGPIQAGDVITFPGGKRVFARSTIGDLDGDARPEFVVAASDDGVEPLRVFAYGPRGQLEHVTGAVDFGIEQMRNVRSLNIGLAVAPGQHRHTQGRRALFVTHEYEIAGTVEHRLSTFLADPGAKPVKVLSPHAAREVARKVLGVTLGSFDPTALPGKQQAADAWLAVADGLIQYRNDGLGELEKIRDVPANNILPGSLITVTVGKSTTSPRRELATFLTSDGRVGVVLPKDPPEVAYASENTVPVDLRRYAPSHLRSRVVQADSTIGCADVDADGFQDLVVLLSLRSGTVLGADAESALLLLPGKPTPTSSKFPFGLPTAIGLTHGNASSMAIGDFARNAAPNYLEIAVAVPVGAKPGSSDGNHVRFYRLHHPNASTWQFVESPATGTLTVGDEPTRVVAADYNLDGRVDLAVASAKDHRLWVYYNFAPTGSVDVDLTGFQTAPANPLALPPGQPRAMLGGDLNGDRVPDLVLVIETGTVVKQQQVAFFLSPGKLGAPGLPLLPGERTGSLVRANGRWQPRNGRVGVALGDLNGDGTPDLVLGWDTVGIGDRNLRVLFGNNF